MTPFTVELTSGRGVIDVDADTVRIDAGVLILLRGDVLLLALAPRVWTACYPADTNPLPEPKPAPKDEPPQILAQAIIDDPLR